MGIGIFSAIEVFLIGFAFLASPQNAAKIMICLTMFVAAAAIRLGAVTINPAVLFVPFLTLLAIVKKRKDKSLIAPKLSLAGVYFILFILYVLLITAFAPRIFFGEIKIAWDFHDKVDLLNPLLRPHSGNVTQMGYLLVAFLCYCTVYSIFSARRSEQDVLSMILWVAWVNIVFSALDIITSTLGIRSFVNMVIRDGNYIMLDSDSIAGLKRVVGTFTEASFYSSYTLGILGALLALYAQNYKRKLTGSLLAVTLVFLILSLSTTAYVGLFLYIMRFLIPNTLRLLSGKRISKTALAGITVVVIAASGLILTYIVMNGITVIDDLIFKKADSESGRIRASLNYTAWSAFLDSYGMGIGVGSTRASSFILVLLSNTGVVGTILFALFLKNSFSIPDTSQATQDTKTVIIACREGAIANLIGASLSTPIFDLGLLIYVFIGAANAINSTRFNEGRKNLLNKRRIALPAT